MPLLVTERIKDLATAAVLIVVGIGGFLFINPTGAAVSNGPGGLSWRSLPFIYSGLLLALTAVYLLTSIRGLAAAIGAPEEAGPASDPGEQAHARLTNLRRLGVVVCVVAYIMVLPPFGFVLTTPVLLFVMFYLFGRTNLVGNLLTALIGGFALALLFIGFLKLPLHGALWDPATRWLNGLMRSIGA